VFLVVYKDILQLGFVEQLLDMMAKAFIGSVLPTLTRRDGVYFLQGDIFGPHYQIVYSKWDEVVKSQQQAPKKMRSFAET
jgi:hypothetical protein